MSDDFTLNAQVRSETGKGFNRRLRRLENKLPGVIYGAGKDTTALTLDHNKVIKALENEAFYSSILTLDIGGTKEKAVIKDIQRHPAKAKVLHMDFLRVSATEKLTMRIPLHFIGADVAPGVKQQGGVVQHHMTDVEIRCLPADLPEFIAVDISELELDQSIHMSGLKLPKAVELVDSIEDTEHDHTVVSIHIPKVVVEEEPVEEEVEAAAEGEEAAAEEGGKQEKPEGEQEPEK